MTSTRHCDDCVFFSYDPNANEAECEKGHKLRFFSPKSAVGSLYITLGEPEGPLDGCTCEVGDWAADEIKRLRAALTDISEGDIGRPHRIEKCVHGSYGFQPCENCYMDFAAKVLENVK